MTLPPPSIGLHWCVRVLLAFSSVAKVLGADFEARISIILRKFPKTIDFLKIYPNRSLYIVTPPRLEMY